jgi:hypothetical protein
MPTQIVHYRERSSFADPGRSTQGQSISGDEGLEEPHFGRKRGSAVLADDPDLFMIRGLILTNKQDCRKALADLDQAIEKRKTAEGYIARGKTYEASNDPVRPASDLRTALPFPPQNAFDISPLKSSLSRRSSNFQSVSDAVPRMSPIRTGPALEWRPAAARGL